MHVITYSSKAVEIAEIGCKIYIRKSRKGEMTYILIYRATDHFQISTFGSFVLWAPGKFTDDQANSVKDHNYMDHNYIYVNEVGIVNTTPRQNDATIFKLVLTDLMCSDYPSPGREVTLQSYPGEIIRNVYYSTDIRDFQIKNVTESRYDNPYHGYKLVLHSYLAIIGFKRAGTTQSNKTKTIQTMIHMMIRFVEETNIKGCHYVLTCTHNFLLNSRSIWYIGQECWDEHILGYIHVNVVSYKKVYHGDGDEWLRNFAERGSRAIIT